MSIEIHWRPASRRNYDQGRGGMPITHIIIHTEQGSDAGSAAWFANPAAHASAHYMITFDGRVFQEIKDEDTAWHAGNGPYNRCSIAIELEGFYERAQFPAPMMDALIALIQVIREAHPDIPLDREHIIGHCEVPDPKHEGQVGGLNHHQDPGPAFPWTTLVAGLGIGLGEPDESAEMFVENAPAYSEELSGPEQHDDPEELT